MSDTRWQTRVSPSIDRKQEDASRAKARAAAKKRRVIPGFEMLEERITPFKPYTHVLVANEAYNDIVADGKVTIQERIVDDAGQLTLVDHEYVVNAELVTALQNNHASFQAGAIAGDGFPDLLMGQGVLHPDNVGLWARHILKEAWAWTGADKPQVLAWSYGYMSHLAGDIWAHTFVNEFSGGAFPEIAHVVTTPEGKSNAIKHIIVEGYIGDATPGYDGNETRTELFGTEFVRKEADDFDQREFSENSTPGFEFAAPHQFIYETFIKAGVIPPPPAVPTGVPTNDRGPLMGFFITLRDNLRDAAGADDSTPIADKIANLVDVKADSQGLTDAINAWNACSGASCVEAGANLIAEALEYGFTVAIDELDEAIDNLLAAAEDTIRDAIAAIFGGYLNAWADDIDAGLQHWSELGLGLTNAMFNAQSKRDAQNGLGAGYDVDWKDESEESSDRISGEYGIGAIDVILYELDEDFTDSAHGGKSFVENHLMPMLGFPDFFSDIKDVAGDLLASVSDFIDTLTNPFNGAFDFLNPLDNAITDAKAAVKNHFKDLLTKALEDTTGVNVPQFVDFMSHGSRHMDDSQINLGVQLVNLFGPNDHEKLDAYLGITEADHHTAPGSTIVSGHEIKGGVLKDHVVFDPTVFAAYRNAVTLTKLAFLDGAGMDGMISDFLGWSAQGNSYKLYSNVTDAPANVMFVGLPEFDPNDANKDGPEDLITDSTNTWLNSIDGSHQWRSDANPIFNGSGGTQGDPGPPPVPPEHSGNGNFPLWESCLLRDGVFRKIFADWQDDFRDDGIINRSAFFPDHDDDHSHDRNEITPTTTFDAGSGVLTIAGSDIDDTITVRRFSEGGNQYIQIEWDDIKDGDVIYGCGEITNISVTGLIRLTVNLGDGNDGLTVDNSNGIIVQSIGLDGEAGVNVLVIAGAPGSAIARESYLAGQSKIVLDPDGNMGVGAAGTANGDEEVITYANIVRIDDTKPVTQLDIFGLAGVDGFSVGAGAEIDGVQTTKITDTNTAFVTIQFGNKTTATLNGLDGADTFTIDLETAATGLATLKFYGNELSNGGFETDDSSADSFTLRVTPGITTEAHGGGGADTFSVGNTSNSLDDIAGQLSINGGAHPATPTTTFTCGPVSNAQPTGDSVTFHDEGDTTTGHTYTLSDVSLNRTGLANPISFAAVETLTVNTGTQAATVNITDTPDNSNTVVTTQGGADVVTITTTGAAGNLRVKTAGSGDQLNLRGSGAGSIVELEGEAGDDTIRISSNAGTNNDGNLNGIGGAVCVEAGAGSANRLIISDFGGDANPDAVVTSSTITGFAGTAEDKRIEYKATGGAFTNGATNDGILLRGSNTGNDQFTILSTLAGSTTKVETGGGADQVNVGSKLADDNGNLDLIAGLLTLDLGASGVGTRDQVYVNDRAKSGRANYTLDPTELVNFVVPANFVAADPLAALINPARPLFLGIHYAGAEFFRLDGTDEVNIFDVKPSLATEFFIDGNLPPPGECLPGGGDYLALDTSGTTGRKLHISGLGAGHWSFTSGHKNVGFESIERFNHVDVIAVGNARGLPIVDVFDAETGEFRFRVSAYESFVRTGVRVATGDVNCDGLPDVITTPALGRTVAVRAFSGAPDQNGNYGGASLFSFDAYPSTFKSGAYVAVGDVNGDGALDIITGADAGWLPQVRVFDGTTLGPAPTLLKQFNAFGNSFRGGVRVAAGDVDGDGRAEIIAGSGTGMVGTVRVFNGAGYALHATIIPFGNTYKGGVFVAAGDVDGDGTRDVIASADGGWLPVVAVFDGEAVAAAAPAVQLARFMPFPNTTRTGVRVAVKPRAAGNPGFVEAVDLVLSSGPGGGATSRRVRKASFAASLTPAVTDKLFASSAFDGLFLG